MLDVNQLRHLLMVASLVGMLVQFSGLVKRDLVPYTTFVVAVTVAMGSR
jgi:hypothetical protein